MPQLIDAMPFVKSRPADVRNARLMAGSSRALVAGFAVCLMIAAALLVTSPQAQADDATEAESRMATRVIELFTSHGCSSCPRADALLGRLIGETPELVALEFHVDYWNSLVHGSAGSWADPFSESAWSLRQRAYDGRPLAGRVGVYTPQAIINGGYSAVGSDDRRIRKALGTEPPRPPTISISREGDSFAVAVSGVRFGEREARTPGHLPAPTPDTGEVALVRYIKRAATSITAGENKGIELVNHRIVTSIETLGRVDAAGSLSARVGVPDDENEGCAILVRHGDKMAVLAGTVCPDPV